MRAHEFITEATIKQELPMNDLSKKIKPYLMTWGEYSKMANPSSKWHESGAYDFSLRELNRPSQHDEIKSMKPMNSKMINGRSFTFYASVGDKTNNNYVKSGAGTNNVEYYSQDEKEQMFSGKKHTYDFKVVDDDTGNIVGTAQDEWGALLIAVAKEYRGFGLGVMLGTLMRGHAPEYDSGGLTQAGYNNLFKVYSGMVKKAMASGTYSKLIRANQMTVARAKEIVDSANLKIKEPSALNPKKTFENKSKDWLMMNSEGGAFILYNKKLIDMYLNDDVADHFKKDMIIGMGYASGGYNQDSTDVIIHQFGGKDDNIKKLMMDLIMSDSQQNGENVRVENSIDKYVDKSKVRKARNFYNKSETVYTPVKYDIDMSSDFKQEARYRKKRDPYSEFTNWLEETATQMFDSYLD